MGLPHVIFLGIDLVPFAVGFIEFYALYLAISLSLNLEFGYAGVPNFGKVLFIAGGAAFAGSITGRLAAFVFGVGTNLDYITFNNKIIAQVDALLLKDPLFSIELVLLALVIAALVGAFLGYLASYPAIRLREDYLGLLLLGMAQFFSVVLRTYRPLIGGAQPTQVPDPFIYFSTLGSGYRDLAVATVLGVFAIAVYIYVEKTVRSPLGRTLRAVRDNEDASAALGKDNIKMKRNALIVASAIAAMAGALYSFSVASVEYDTWTRFAWTFWPFLIVILGGVANNSGIAVGTFFFTLFLKGLEQEQPNMQPYIFFNAAWLQDLLFAGLLLAVLYLRPDGILREKSSHTLPAGMLGIIVKGGVKEGNGFVSRILLRLKGLVKRSDDPAAAGQKVP